MIMRYLYPKIVGFLHDDHSVYFDVKNIPGRNQSILIDCGNNNTLSVKDFIKLSAIFISHAHIDHFIGFDNVLRMNLRENKKILVIGPAPLSAMLHHKLRGYSWNLIYDSQLEFEVWDISRFFIKKYLFKCHEKFSKKHLIEKIPAKNPLIDNQYYSCSYTILKHDIPSIAYSLKEKDNIKIDKLNLSRLNLPEGQWLKKLKNKSFAKDEEITFNSTHYLMQDLYGKLIKIEKGLKISYVTDTVFTSALKKKITDFVKDSDELYCESTFLNKDIRLAKEYFHLTARQTALIAKEANVKKLYLIHLSSRYSNPCKLLEEAKTIFPRACFPNFPNKLAIRKKI